MVHIVDWLHASTILIFSDFYNRNQLKEAYKLNLRKIKMEREIIRNLLNIIDRMKSSKSVTIKKWKCKTCFAKFDKKSILTRHICSVHLGMRQASLGKVSKLDTSRYMTAIYEPKEMSSQDTSDEEYVNQIKKQFNLSDLQEEGCSSYLNSLNFKNEPVTVITRSLKFT